VRKISPVHVVDMEDEVRGSQLHGGNLRMRARSVHMEDEVRGSQVHGANLRTRARFGGESGRWALYSTTSESATTLSEARAPPSLIRLRR
jgi:hypothetical protein